MKENVLEMVIDEEQQDIDLEIDFKGETVDIGGGGGNTLPIEVSTEAKMNALLETAEVGSVYKYTGTTGTYENGALYVVELEDNNGGGKIFTKLGNTDEAFEAGKQAEWEAFWDVLQNHGNPANYYYVFAYNRFSDNNYNPKYPIVSSSGNTPSQALFYSNTLITDTKVEIIPAGNIGNCFYKMSNCHTIRKITVTESTTFNNTFVGCSSLVNIEFGGTIGANISFEDSPLLSATSIESIINALSSTASGLSVTLSATAVNNAFTTDEWHAFIATKPNWTISLM